MTEHGGSKTLPGAIFRRVSGGLLLVAAIVLIVGMFVPPVWVTVTGFALFMAGALLTAVRMIFVMIGSRGQSSPEARNALINLIIMIVVFALSLVGLILIV